MKDFFISLKEKTKSNFNIIGGLIEKYRLNYIIVLFMVAAFEIFFIVYWFFNIKDYSKPKNIMYLSSYILLLTTSLFGMLLLYLNKSKQIISKFCMAIALHIYAFIFYCWATIISILDLSNGSSPIVILTISMILSGLLMLSPIFYISLSFLSYLTIIIFNIINNYAYFDGVSVFLNVGVFVIMTIIMSLRHYRTSINEAKQRAFLEKLSYTDQLTGLGNDAAYLKMVDKINKEIEEGIASFGVVMLDLNNLKATNDMYGHQYGCHLVVETGHILPKIFNSSELFHIGGDEFICIIRGEDLNNIDNILSNINKMLKYSIINYDGKDLVLSVACGYKEYENGMTYKEVLQKADEYMYENKAKMKDELKINDR